MSGQMTIPCKLRPKSLALVFLLGVALASCGEDYDAELLSLSPEKAYESQAVVVSGSALGKQGATSVILTQFDGETEIDISDSVTTWSATEFTFLVPGSLSDSPFILHIEEGGIATNRLRFEVLLPPDPLVEVVTPPAGQFGDSITLKGSDFGEQSGAVFFFPDHSATIRSWTNSEVVIEVPDLEKAESLRLQRASGYLSPWFPFALIDPTQPTLTLIQETIFTPRCSTSSCHGALESGNLSLLSGESWENLVYAGSRQEGNLLRVAPFAPDSSFLVDKLENPSPAYGARMPLMGGLLNQEQLDLIRAWIDQGAQDN